MDFVRDPGTLFRGSLVGGEILGKLTAQIEWPPTRDLKII